MAIAGKSCVEEDEVGNKSIEVLVYNGVQINY